MIICRKIRSRGVSAVLSVFIFFLAGSCERDFSKIIKIDSVSVSEISSSSCLAKSAIIDLGEGDIEEHGFCWSQTEAPIVSSERNLLGVRTECGEFTKIITGLSANTKYYLRAYVQSGGKVIYSEQVDFNTLEEGGQPSGTTNTAPLITSSPVTEAVVGQLYSYQIIAQDTNQGDVITYSIISAPSGFIIDGSTGWFSGTPGEALYGEHGITLRASDNHDLYDEQSFTLKVSYGPDILYDARDGNTYAIVTLGSQVWMAQDLRYLPAVSPSTVDSYTEPNYYVYGYEGYNVSEAKALSVYTDYGALYNWPAAMAGESSSTSNPSGVQGVCPSGWHLPSDAEWKQLEIYLGMSQSEANGSEYRGTDQGSRMAGRASAWTDGELVNSGVFGSSGLDILPSGCRYIWDLFDHVGDGVSLWATDEYNSTDAMYRGLYYDRTEVYRINRPKEEGYSVRCVKD